jgi:hypothetical protein
LLTSAGCQLARRIALIVSNAAPSFAHRRFRGRRRSEAKGSSNVWRNDTAAAQSKTTCSAAMHASHWCDWWPRAPSQDRPRRAWVFVRSHVSALSHCRSYSVEIASAGSSVNTLDDTVARCPTAQSGTPAGAFLRPRSNVRILLFQAPKQTVNGGAMRSIRAPAATSREHRRHPQARHFSSPRTARVLLAVRRRVTTQGSHPAGRR